MINVDHGCLVEQHWMDEGRLLAELEAAPEEDLLAPIGELLARGFDELDLRVVEIRVRAPRIA